MMTSVVIARYAMVVEAAIMSMMAAIVMRAHTSDELPMLMMLDGDGRQAASLVNLNVHSCSNAAVEILSQDPGSSNDQQRSDHKGSTHVILLRSPIEHNLQDRSMPLL